MVRFRPLALAALVSVAPLLPEAAGHAEPLPGTTNLVCEGEVWVHGAAHESPRFACRPLGDVSTESRLRGAGFRPMRPIPVVTRPSDRPATSLVVEFDPAHQQLVVRDARGRVRLARALEAVAAEPSCCGLESESAECALYPSVASAWADPDSKLVALRLDTVYTATACGLTHSVAVYTLHP